MDLSPVQVSSASFRTVRKGYDPDEVDAFLQRTSKALEEAQQQATAMEARARAAVARLQEMSAAAEQSPAPPLESDAERADVVRVSANEAETISRTLVLAQRTADATVADAAAEAARIRAEAQAESDATLDSTREMSAKLLDDARVEARRLSESERAAAENEVQSLVARREFLVGDVEQLDQFLVDQRERLRTAARQIEAMCDRVPAGLGHVRPPLLSASDDPPGDDTSEQFRPSEAATLDFDEPDDTEQQAEAWGADAPTLESAQSSDTPEPDQIDADQIDADQVDADQIDTVLLEATARFDVRNTES